eukprot:6197011-Pleurochrysis_carterae.AAC.1
MDDIAHNPENPVPGKGQQIAPPMYSGVAVLDQGASARSERDTEDTFPELLEPFFPTSFIHLLNRSRSRSFSRSLAS